MVHMLVGTAGLAFQRGHACAGRRSCFCVSEGACVCWQPQLLLRSSEGMRVLAATTALVFQRGHACAGSHSCSCVSVGACVCWQAQLLLCLSVQWKHVLPQGWGVPGGKVKSLMSRWEKAHTKLAGAVVKVSSHWAKHRSLLWHEDQGLQCLKDVTCATFPESTRLRPNQTRGRDA
eukprot:453634-Pelagomonas_calceolata.AAC.7